MNPSPLGNGDLPDVPNQVLQDMAVKAFQSKLRCALDAISRAQDNAEQVTVNSTAREYAAKQLERASTIIDEAFGILVEHGCTIDLEEADGFDLLVAEAIDLTGAHLLSGEGGAA